MKKYIDADKIHDVIASHFCACSDETEAALHSVWDELKAIPGEDVAEVRRGHWIHDINNLYGCSECGERETMSHTKKKKFCPNCGALMEPTP